MLAAASYVRTEKQKACMIEQRDDVMVCYKFKKSIVYKSSIQFKFRLYHYFSYNKFFKARSHMSIFQ
jgi:hypothetical protein